MFAGFLPFASRGLPLYHFSAARLAHCVVLFARLRQALVMLGQQVRLSVKTGIRGNFCSYTSFSVPGVACAAPTWHALVWTLAVHMVHLRISGRLAVFWADPGGVVPYACCVLPDYARRLCQTCMCVRSHACIPYACCMCPFAGLPRGVDRSCREQLPAPKTDVSSLWQKTRHAEPE